MKRIGMVGKLKADKVDHYITLHEHTWPAVLARNRDCHLQNYSIFYKPMPNGEHWLFGYVEYVGDDFDADMAKLAADPQIQKWWDECKPCFEQFEPMPAGEVWAPMRSVFYQP